MSRKVHILSYFSLPTDLAAQMRDWKEFVAGQVGTAAHDFGELTIMQVDGVVDAALALEVEGYL